MVLHNLHDLYLEQLRQAYTVECTLLNELLPRLLGQAYRKDLKRLIEEHTAETRDHLDRLIHVFAELGLELKGAHSDALSGIEAQAEREVHAQPVVRDAVVIALMQRIEHLEMALYGTLAAYATSLELDPQAVVLHDTLREEIEMSQRLAGVAHVNLTHVPPQLRQAV